MSPENQVLVPTSLLQSAWHALANKKDAPKTLYELHSYAFGDHAQPTDSGFSSCDMADQASKGFRDGAKELERVTAERDAALAELEQCKRDVERMRKALEFYANGDHLLLAEPDAWDTCSGEPVNVLHDAAGTASVEDGSIAKQALSTHPSQGCGVLNKQTEVKP